MVFLYEGGGTPTPLNGLYSSHGGECYSSSVGSLSLSHSLYLSLSLSLSLSPTLSFSLCLCLFLSLPLSHSSFITISLHTPICISSFFRSLYLPLYF